MKIMKIVHPFLSYDAAICECSIPPFKVYMEDQSSQNMIKIHNEHSHPLNKMLILREGSNIGVDGTA